MTTPQEFQSFLAAPEGARLEFKEAKGGFHFDKLVEYVVALANEGGGKIILGVTDKRPRQVVGTHAFAEPGRTEAGLFDRLRRRVEIEEFDQIKSLVKELKAEGQIRLQGQRRAARWFPVVSQNP